MSSLSKKAPKIALIQLHVPADSTPASQFRRAESFIRQAATNDADLAILPEMALGYCTPDNLFGHATACALALVNFQSLAKELHINIIPGSYLSVADNSASSDLKFYNTTCYIYRTGEVLHTYHKVNLWGSERLSCAPGTIHQAFDTPEFGPIGLLICWDLAFPEAFRALIKQGANYIFIPTMWKSQDCGEKGLKHSKNSEKTFIDSIITARAFEENCVLVFCNVGGDCAGGSKGPEDVEEEGYFGASQITMPFKGQIARCDGREQCLVVEVDDAKEVLQDAEEVWGIRGDVGSDSWYLKDI